MGKLKMTKEEQEKADEVQRLTTNVAKDLEGNVKRVEDVPLPDEEVTELDDLREQIAEGNVEPETTERILELEEKEETAEADARQNSDAYVAKVVHLRVSVGSENTQKMDEFLADMKQAVLDAGAKNATSLGEEYIVGGQRVRVDDYEKPKPAKKQSKSKKPKEKESPSE